MILVGPLEPFTPLDRETIRNDLAAMRTFLRRATAFRNQTQLSILMRTSTEVNIGEVPALDILAMGILDIIWTKHRGFWASIRSGTSPEAVLVQSSLAAVHRFYNDIVDHYPNYNTHMIEDMERPWSTNCMSPITLLLVNSLSLTPKMEDNLYQLLESTLSEMELETLSSDDDREQESSNLVVPIEAISLQIDGYSISEILNKALHYTDELTEFLISLNLANLIDRTTWTHFNIRCWSLIRECVDEALDADSLPMHLLINLKSGSFLILSKTELISTKSLVGKKVLPSAILINYETDQERWAQDHNYHYYLNKLIISTQMQAANEFCDANNKQQASFPEVLKKWLEKKSFARAWSKSIINHYANEAGLEADTHVTKLLLREVRARDVRAINRANGDMSEVLEIGNDSINKMIEDLDQTPPTVGNGSTHLNSYLSEAICNDPLPLPPLRRTSLAWVLTLRLTRRTLQAAKTINDRIMMNIDHYLREMMRRVSTATNVNRTWLNNRIAGMELLNACDFPQHPEKRLHRQISMLQNSLKEQLQNCNENWIPFRIIWMSDGTPVDYFGSLMQVRAGIEGWSVRDVDDCAKRNGYLSISMFIAEILRLSQIKLEGSDDGEILVLTAVDPLGNASQRDQEKLKTLALSITNNDSSFTRIAGTRFSNAVKNN